MASDHKDEKPYINPHGGRELELMLAEHKPMSHFVAEKNQTLLVGDEEFKPHVEAKRIKRYSCYVEHAGVELRSYALPGQEWRAKLMNWVCSITSEDADRISLTPVDRVRLSGFLLGYSDTDVEKFVKHLQSQDRI